MVGEEIAGKTVFKWKLQVRYFVESLIFPDVVFLVAKEVALAGCDGRKFCDKLDVAHFYTYHVQNGYCRSRSHVI
jgi:hypothetical protein